LVDNKEGEEEDADNNAGGSRLISILRLGGRLILNTFRVGGTNSLEAGPLGQKKYNLASITITMRESCKIFDYLTAGHLLESKSLTEVLMCVMILLICSSFNLFTSSSVLQSFSLNLLPQVSTASVR